MSAIATQGPPDRPPILRHLGKPSTVSQALSKLRRRKDLLRIYHDIYLRTVMTPFGRGGPVEHDVVQAFARESDEVIATGGGWAANALSLCGQVPLGSVISTTGRDRALHYGMRRIDLRGVPAW